MTGELARERERASDGDLGKGERRRRRRGGALTLTCGQRAADRHRA